MAKLVEVAAGGLPPSAAPPTQLDGPAMVMLDLAYAEDSIADADVNVVANADGELIEVQGTAEGRPFSKADFDQVLDLTLRGITQLIEAQRAALR